MTPETSPVRDRLSPGREAAESVDVRDYLRPIWRYKWLVVLLVIVATAVVYAKQSRLPQEFAASTRVYVGLPTASQILGGTGSIVGDRNVANQAALVTTRATAQAAARDIGFQGRPSSLLSRVTATAETTTDFIEIRATGPTGRSAADTANGFARAFIRLTGETNRQRAVEARTLAQRQLAGVPRGLNFADQREALQAQIGQLSAAINTPSGSAEIVDPAQPPSQALSPRPGRDAVFAFVVALAAGIGLAFVLARLDRRIRRVEDVPTAYGLPMLAAVPHSSETHALQDGKNATLGALKETFRGLRSNMLLAALGTDVRVLVVVSATPAEGKSTTTRNLALAYHEAGVSVCVVDADLRRPSQRRLFHLPDVHVGLTDVLVGQAALDEALVEIPVSEAVVPRGAAGRTTASEADPARFSLLHSGLEPANPQAVLASEPTRELIEELKRRFDLVLIDTPPLLVVTDAVPLVVEADGVVVVGRVNQTNRDSASKVAELLGRTRANVLGVVGNDVSGFGQKAGQYAYYGYGYGHEDERPTRRAGKARSASSADADAEDRSPVR